MASPRRVSDAIFRRDMVGPSFMHVITAVTSLLLIEKVAMEFLLPAWLPWTEARFLAQGKLTFLAVSGFAVSTAGFWGCGLVFALPALFHMQRWKIQPNRKMDFSALARSMPTIVFNFLFGSLLVPPLLCLLLPETAFDFKQLPATATLLRDVLVWLAVEEVSFFYVHRWLHENKAAYQKIHKLHHTWTAPVSFVAIYCHPVEHIVSNIFPLIAGPILCGSHVLSTGVFMFASLLHTCAVHSGYWICDDNGMHDEHHAKFTVNYGVIGVMDSWYGTYRLPPGAAGAEEAPARAAKRA